MKTWITVLLIGAYLFAPAYAATNTARVHEYQLKNGLKLIVKEDHRAPVAIMEVWYKVGSSYETNGTTGVSHALEHMMFRGSKNYSASEFLRTISENGGQQNAFTSNDYTGYYEMASADKLPISFKLEADRMRNLLLQEQDFNKEIQVVMEERRLRTEDDPQQLTYERFMAALHVSNPYHHPVIGWMSDLQNMTVNDLKNWYQTWYAPNNALVVVVGDVNPDQVYQLAEQYFGPLPSSQVPVLKPRKEIAAKGERTVVVEAPAKLPWLILGYNTPVLNTAQEKWEPYALTVLAGILGGGDSARLPTDLVRGKQIVTDIGVNYSAFDGKDNAFFIQATPAPGHTVEEVKQAVLAEIKKIQDQPVTAEELQRIKAQIIAARVFQEDSISFQAEEIGSLEAVGLPWQEADNMIKQVETITAAQVQAVARKYLVSDNLTIGILKPLPIAGNKPAQPESHVGGGNVH